MAIVFGYTPATNIVVVTGGTAGVPATFADFVTADRAGSYAVMDAIATAMNLTLDRLIRPVEFRALKITFTLAGTNAGAGDTVDTTGTDAWGNAQTESINVAAGNGVYVSAKYWRTITDIDCTGFADGVGTIDAVQGQWGVIWDWGDKRYDLACKEFEIGNGATSTHFTEKNAHIFLLDGIATANSTRRITVKSNATFTLGEVLDAVLKSTKNGCVLTTQESNYYNCFLINTQGGHTYLYGTPFVNKYYTYNKRQNLYGNNVTRMWNCQILGAIYLESLGGGGDVYNLFITGAPIALGYPRSVLDEVFISGSCHDTSGQAIFALGGWDFTASNILVKDMLTRLIYAFNYTGTGNLIDMVTDVWSIFWATPNSGRIYRKYTCNIHIVDKDGNNLNGVTVSCQDTDANVVFSVNTNASGDIAEQTISRGYCQSPETDLDTDLTKDYSPHKFTISKAGYETMELDDVTVDIPIVWHLELLPALAVTDVRNGVGFGEDKTGLLDLPSINDVEDGVFFDGATKEGNFEAPAEEDVEVGVGYGSLGTEFLGTYLGLRGENLTAVLEESVALVGHLEKKVALTGELAP